MLHVDFESRGLAREYHVLARNLESPLRVRVETQAEEVVIRNSVGQIIKCEIFWQWDSTCYFSAVTKMKQTYKKLSLKYLREAISLKWHFYAEVRPLKILDRVISFIRLCDFLSLYKEYYSFKNHSSILALISNTKKLAHVAMTWSNIPQKKNAWFWSHNRLAHNKV